MLTIEHLTAGYGGRTILDDISLSVEDGSIVALIGPNGSGKTTLIRSVSGVLPVLAGEICVNGLNVEPLSVQDRARLISVVPQVRSVPPAFTVHEVVALGRTPYLNWLGSYSENDVEAINRALSQTDLTDLAERNMADLSGGEQQRVLLARAMAQDAPVMLLDEPTAHLDLQFQVNLMKRVYRLAHPTTVEKNAGQKGHSILVAVHDMNLLNQFADKVILLVKGRVEANGSPAEVLTSEVLSKGYQIPLSILRDGKTGRTAILPEEKISE